MTGTQPTPSPFDNAVLYVPSDPGDEAYGRFRGTVDEAEQAKFKPQPVASLQAPQLIETEAGGIRACLANAITLLSGAHVAGMFSDGKNPWEGVLAHNEFAMRTLANAPLPWTDGAEKAQWQPRTWTPQDDFYAADWLQHHGCLVNPKVVSAAVEAVAHRRRYHPVRDYLESLKWDGVSRLEDWPSDYLGAENSTYTRAVGSRWMISAVARIFEPGCQADCVLILEGWQGQGKSSALRTLGGEWFTDDLADLTSKDAAMQTAGAWIIEVAELDAFNRAEAARIKAFVSRRIDRFRPPYGERLIDNPRQCVFAGTTNKTDGYLQDATGARRFWPIRVGTPDLAGLERARNHLWAEAVHLYRTRAPWWLDTDELRQEAQHEADARYDADSWDYLVSKYVSAHPSITVGQVLEACLALPPAEWSKQNTMRVGKILTAMGWERYQVRDGPARQWRYRPPVTTMSPPASEVVTRKDE